MKSGGRKLRLKSFALPGVEPGVIVEYHWLELREDDDWFYTAIQFQREFPVQKVTYYLKPLPTEYTGNYRMAVWRFNCEERPLRFDSRGFNILEAENLPAFREEPLMPG